MCSVSSIGDQWKQTFPDRWPSYPKPVDWPTVPYQPVSIPGVTVTATPTINVTKEEFDSLKKEVEELKKLLLAAKEFDEKTGQKDCEMDEKIEFIKKVADFVGVDLNKVFK